MKTSKTGSTYNASFLLNSIGSWVCEWWGRRVRVNKREIITYFILYVCLRNLIIDKNVIKTKCGGERA